MPPDTSGRPARLELPPRGGLPLLPGVPPLISGTAEHEGHATIVGMRTAGGGAARAPERRSAR